MFIKVRKKTDFSDYILNIDNIAKIYSRNNITVVIEFNDKSELIIKESIEDIEIMLRNNIA